MHGLSLPQLATLFVALLAARWFLAGRAGSGL
jgi:hypothetical protein